MNLKLVCWSEPFTMANRVKRTFGDRALNLGDRILEIGCGRGLTSREVLESNPNAQLVAIDIDKDMITSAQKLCSQYSARAQFIHGDGYTLNRTLRGIDLQKFDTVIIMNSLAFVANQLENFILRAILADTISYLDRSGILFVSANSTYRILDRTGKILGKSKSESTGVKRLESNLDLICRNSSRTFKSMVLEFLYDSPYEFEYLFTESTKP